MARPALSAEGRGCHGFWDVWAGAPCALFVADREITVARQQPYSHRRTCPRGSTMPSANSDPNQNSQMTSNLKHAALGAGFGRRRALVSVSRKHCNHVRPAVTPHCSGIQSLILSLLLSSRPCRDGPCQIRSSAAALCVSDCPCIRPAWPRSKKTGDTPKAVPTLCTR